jgi:hypothetical protein
VSPRMKNKRLHDEGGRLSVRAVKSARGAAFIGAKRKPLTEGVDGSGVEFGQEGQPIPVQYGEKSLALQLSRRQFVRTKVPFAAARWMGSRDDL